MRRPHLLVPLLLLTVAAGGFLLLLAQNDATGLPPAAEAASRAPEHGLEQASTQASLPPADIADASASTRSLFAGGERAARAHPADATWIDVLVVDQRGEIVAGADVCWHDPKAFELTFGDRSNHWQQKMMLLTQPDARARRYGWSTVSDASGRAKITAGVNFVVTGHAQTPSGERLFGELYFAAGMLAASATHRLVLLPDQSLEVLVIDTEGRPCQGVPLALITPDQYGHHRSPLQFDELAITDKHGQAELPHLQRYRQAITEDPSYDQSNLKTHVHALLAGNEDPGVAIDLDSLPTGTVTLRLPPCGKVRMRTSTKGTKSEDMFELFLSCPDPQHVETSNSLMPGPGGWATFEHVPTGRTLLAASSDPSGGSVRFEGPRHVGDVVNVTVQPNPDDSWLVTRLLNPLGEPIRNGWFRLYDETTGSQAAEPFASDGQGNARIRIPKKPGETMAELPASWIRSPDIHSNWGRGKLKTRRIATGVTNIGDTTFERGKLIAAGMLAAGEDKPFTGHCYLNLERFDGLAKPEDRWQEVREASCHLLEEGQFTVHSPSSEGRLRLVVDVPDALTIEPVPIQVGDTGLVVQVNPGHSLAIGMLVPAGCELKNLRAQLTPTETRSYDPSIRERFLTRPERSQGERCMATWSGLPADTYTLTLSIWAQPKHLLQIRNIALPQSAPQDSRLRELDLRELVQVVTIECRDENGQRIEDDGALFPREQLHGGKRQGYFLYGANTRMLLPREPLDLVALFDDRQPTPVRGRGPVLSMHCLPWPNLQVALPNPPDMPAGAKFSVTVRTEGADQGTWNDGEFEQQFDTLVTVESSEWGKPGEVVAPLIAEGPHSLQLWLRAKRQKIEIQGITPSRVLASDQAVAIRIPDAQWRATLAKHNRLDSKPPK